MPDPLPPALPVFDGHTPIPRALVLDPSLRGARVSAHYFDIFGVKAALGRTFLPDEDQPGKDP